MNEEINTFLLSFVLACMHAWMSVSNRNGVVTALATSAVSEVEVRHLCRSKVTPTMRYRARIRISG